jgi:ankyrin repeat protein
MRIQRATLKLAGVAALVLFGAARAHAGVELVDAVKKGDKDGIRALLKQRANVNAAEPDGATALHWAVQGNDPEMVDLLIRAGADPRVANRFGATPLSIAAEGAAGAVIARLLDAGADVNSTVGTYGQTVLMTAARYGNTDGVRTLLDRGAYADARETNRGQTALMWAAAEGHADAITLLLKHGADHAVRSVDRDTSGPPRIVSGTPVAVVLRGGLTALLFAARQGQSGGVKALLDGGADVNLPDTDGNSALVLAILNTHYDIAQLLLDRGADPNTANKDGRTPLFTAVEMAAPVKSPLPARREDGAIVASDIVRSLLKKGADANARLKAAAPIEKVAFDHGDKALAAGATPLMAAVRRASIETIKLLLDAGADPKLGHEKDGLNALMLAAGLRWNNNFPGTEAQALETVRTLVALGLDINAATDTGETALHGAATRGADSIVEYLVENGAKVDAKTKDGKTPLDLAMGAGDRPANVGTVALLRGLMPPAPSKAEEATPVRPVTTSGR